MERRKRNFEKGGERERERERERVPGKVGGPILEDGARLLLCRLGLGGFY